MPFIHLTTFIAAPRERVFDLSRSVELHKASMKKFDEKVVDGAISGLMKLDDTVTWTAKHFFKQRRLKGRITKFLRPEYFVDEQVEGDFKMIKHEHYFKEADNGTIMIDQFHFETPFGLFGKIINKIFLENYMKELLTERNRIIKEVAESNLWNQYLY